MEKYLPFIGQLIVQHLFQQHMQNLSDLFPLGNAQCKKISAAYGKIFYTQAGVFCQQLFQAVFRRRSSSRLRTKVTSSGLRQSVYVPSTR